MWMTVIVVLGVVALMVGPVMMVQPTKSQRITAELRSLAAKSGLNVRLAVDASSPVKGIYSIHWPPDIVEGMKDVNWTLEKKSLSHEIHFQGYWDWVGENSADSAIYQVLHQAIDELPEGVFFINAQRWGFECGWDEMRRGRSSEQAVSELASWLKQTADAVCRL